MSNETPKIRSKWWYALPIFFGIFGGVIAWLAISSQDRKLGKNCLILGTIFVVFELLIFLIFSDNFNIITEFGLISETDDLEIQFKLDTP